MVQGWLRVILLCTVALGGLARAGESDPIPQRGVRAFPPVAASIYAGDLRDVTGAAGVVPIPAPPPPRPAGQLPFPLGRFAPPIVDVDGMRFRSAFPSDAVGDVGVDYYIQMANRLGGFSLGADFQIHDKTGRLVLLGFPLDVLSDHTLRCRSGSGQPIVLYDALAGRWIMTELSLIGLFGISINHLCVYVSRTGDPLAGGWYMYAFPITEPPTFPKYGVWPDAYYVSTSELSGPAVYALERERMLAGEPARFQRAPAPSLPRFDFQALIPADLDGETPPPAGAPGLFLRHRDEELHDAPDTPPVPSVRGGDAKHTRPDVDTLELFELYVDFDTPGSSRFVGPIPIEVSDFDSRLCPGSPTECIPQPGTETRLDAVREVVGWRVPYRNFGGHESLVGSFTVAGDTPEHAGVRWFELRKSGGGEWRVEQEGTFAPDSDSRWVASPAQDRNGNLALGYSVGSAQTFPSIRYAGRLAGDPSGTLGVPEVSLIEGGGSQTGTSRWGDYTSLNVDPVDDCTFWYTNQYLPETDPFEWRTRIGAFKLPGCNNRPPVAVAAAPASVECTSPAGARVTLDATATVDPDSSPGSNNNVVRFEWLRETATGTEPIGDGETREVALPLGVSRIVLLAHDLAGAVDSDALEVNVRDTTAPELTVGLEPSVLRPKHRLVDVHAQVEATDLCGPVAIALDSISVEYRRRDRSHPARRRDVRGAEIGEPDFEFQLRAASSRRGRAYDVVYTAIDTSGNVASASDFVSAPRSRARHHRGAHGHSHGQGHRRHAWRGWHAGHESGGHASQGSW